MSATVSATRRASRPRLDRLLTGSIDENRVTVVVATAGAGKTTAIADAARRQRRPIAWLDVDRADQAPGALLARLGAELTRVRPALARVLSTTSRDDLPAAELAGVLAEAIGDRPLLLVLDELQRLERAAGAWALVEAVLRYAPDATRIVLSSRRDIPTDLCGLTPEVLLGWVDEAELAFTADEARIALEQRGRPPDDVPELLAATGGWVTGVLDDDLAEYLSRQILDPLSGPARSFLVSTAVLAEVTAQRAAALGLGESHGALAELRAAHLPAQWTDDGLVMRCHPCLRDHLLTRLERQDGERLRELRLAHAALLVADGDLEEATEELMRAGAWEPASSTAERAILPVFERFDLATAGRWVASLAGRDPGGRAPHVATAGLLLSIARDDYGRAAALADDIVRGGDLPELADRSPLAVALMAWAYLHAGRIEDAASALAAGAVGPSVDAVAYALQLATGAPARAGHPTPEPSGGLLDTVILRAAVLLGHDDTLDVAARSAWEEATTAPWRIAALRASGHTEHALERYRSALEAGVTSAALHAFVGPEVLIDAERAAEARRAVDAGRLRAQRSGSLGFRMLNAIADAKLRLRLEDDAAGALRVLDDAGRELGSGRFPFMRAQLEVWSGLALLAMGADAEALARLDDVVRAMRRDDGRAAALPTAAVYLAEAQFRAGLAPTAADLALATARSQRADHELLQALADVPSVASRALATARGPESPWHEIGRRRSARGTTVAGCPRADLELRDFGKPTILIDGEVRRPRLAKSGELLVFLALQPGRWATREEIIEAVFGGRSDASTRAYMRQAVHQVRKLWPHDRGLSIEGQVVRLAPGLTTTIDSARFKSRLLEAAELRGAPRIEATLEALELAGGDSFLADVTSEWAEERRRDLADLAADARIHAAQAAFELGRFAQADALCTAVLAEHPWREAAWCLMMRIAGALGDEDGVILTYRRCEHALRQLDASPSDAVRRLLKTLRR